MPNQNFFERFFSSAFKTKCHHRNPSNIFTKIFLTFFEYYVHTLQPLKLNSNRQTKKFLRTFARFLWHRMQSKIWVYKYFHRPKKSYVSFHFWFITRSKVLFLAFVCNTKNVSKPLFEHKKLQ